VQNFNDDSTPAVQQTGHKATQKNASHSHGLFTKVKTSASSLVSLMTGIWHSQATRSAMSLRHVRIYQIITASQSSEHRPVRYMSDIQLSLLTSLVQHGCDFVNCVEHNTICWHGSCQTRGEASVKSAWAAICHQLLHHTNQHNMSVLINATMHGSAAKSLLILFIHNLPLCDAKSVCICTMK